MANIYQRWGQSMGSDQEWNTLKNRLNIILDGRGIKVTKDEAKLFAFISGHSLEDVAYQNDYAFEWYVETGKLIDQAATPFDLARIIEGLLNSINTSWLDKDGLVKVINSSNSGIRISRATKGWQSYPAGEKNLDEKLVDQPLSFLKGQSLEEFRKALQHFSAKKWEECSEKVRRSLEEYLREYLGNQKGLKSNIPELGKGLSKEAKLPNHLKNTLTSLLGILDTNFNASSKHNSKTYNEEECEFLIYQAGLVMRLLDRINLKPE